MLKIALGVGSVFLAIIFLKCSDQGRSRTYNFPATMATSNPYQPEPFAWKATLSPDGQTVLVIPPVFRIGE